MRRIAFDPVGIDPMLVEQWSAWMAGAQTASESVIAASRAKKTLPFQQPVWAALKEWLFEHVFDLCCAYCEGRTEPQAYGDGEHWRPKAGVTRLDGSPVTRDGTDHPGYFWLAHDWRNLLPACQKCNVGTKASPGKGTRFPIAGDYVFSPDEVADIEELGNREQPLLLHPFHGPDPSEHLGFDEFGNPTAIDGSSLGEASIEVFALYRAGLRTARQRRHKAMRLVVKEAIVKSYDDGTPVADTIAAYLQSDPEYSAACHDYAWWHYDCEVEKLGEQRQGRLPGPEA